MSEIWIDRRVLLHWTSTGGVASWVRWYGGGIVSMSIAGRGGEDGILLQHLERGVVRSEARLRPLHC